MPPVSEVDMGPVEESSGGLERSDCLCPICLDIFLEPVTLPCTHTFCKPCFLETVDKSNMCCPLCRKRVSTWARLNGRNKTLVNIALWRRIQDAFPAQCERRVQGIDDCDDAGMLKPYVLHNRFIVMRIALINRFLSPPSADFKTSSMSARRAEERVRGPDQQGERFTMVSLLRCGGFLASGH